MTDLISIISQTLTALLLASSVYQNKKYFNLFVTTIIYILAIIIIYQLFGLILPLYCLSLIIVFGYACFLRKQINIDNVLITIIPFSIYFLIFQITYVLFKAINITFFPLDSPFYPLLCNIIAIIIIYLISIYLFNLNIKQNYLILLSNGIGILIIFIFFQYLDYIIISKPINPYFILVLLFLLLIMNLLVFKEANQNIKLLYKKKLELGILEEKRKNYYLSREMIDNTRKLNHDLHHIYNLLLYQLVQNDNEAVRKTILKQLQLLDNQRLIISGNDIIDYCISMQSKIIKDKNIYLSCDQLSDKFPISDEDLFILFGNLFLNAVENCQPNPKCQIMINSGVIDEFMYLKIKNTIDKPVALNSTKDNQEMHGLGLPICRNVIEKYDGHLLIESDNIFCSVKVLFKKE